jgi:hypothetical protein
MAAPQSFVIALIGLRKLDLKSTPWRPILVALVSTILANPDFDNGDGENGVKITGGVTWFYVEHKIWSRWSWVVREGERRRESGDSGEPRCHLVARL